MKEFVSSDGYVVIAKDQPSANRYFGLDHGNKRELLCRIELDSPGKAKHVDGMKNYIMPNGDRQSARHLQEAVNLYQKRTRHEIAVLGVWQKTATKEQSSSIASNDASASDIYQHRAAMFANSNGSLFAAKRQRAERKESAPREEFPDPQSGDAFAFRAAIFRGNVHK